jgi:peptidoglycan/xylan/chitin deacetylase (PgdA/CDA1 family)
MRWPGLKAARQSARWLASRIAPGVLILGYHRIDGDGRGDAYGMCVGAKHFAEQLAVLSRKARPISLQALLDGLRERRLPRRAVVLTFDDGYADTLYQAMPWLDRFKMPATVFVTTGFLGREFWWDELARAVQAPALLRDGLRLRIAGEPFSWPPAGGGRRSNRNHGAGSRQALQQALYQRLLPVPAAQRASALGEIWEQAGADGRQAVACRSLAPDELRQLARADLIEIGAHSVTHPNLASLPATLQQAEIQASKACLEELLEREVTSFSYPNGSLSTDTRALVQAAGFNCACASHSGMTLSWSDPYRLPRFWVPDWDGEAFDRWLSRWLH